MLSVFHSVAFTGDEHFSVHGNDLLVSQILMTAPVLFTAQMFQLVCDSASWFVS